MGKEGFVQLFKNTHTCSMMMWFRSDFHLFFCRDKCYQMTWSSVITAWKQQICNTPLWQTCLAGITPGSTSEEEEDNHWKIHWIYLYHYCSRPLIYEEYNKWLILKRQLSNWFIRENPSKTWTLVLVNLWMIFLGWLNVIS